MQASRSPAALRRLTSWVSLRIAAGMMPVLALILTLFAVAGAGREGQVVELEMQRDADAVATTVAHLAHADDPGLASIVADLDRRLPHLTIRLHATDTPPAPRPDQVTSQAPLTAADGTIRGWVVVAEPLAERDAFVTRALLTDAIGGLAAMVVAAGLAVAVGRTVVERRVAAVIQRLAQVGRGELPDRPLSLGSDELGVLGRAVNEMIDQLQAARARAVAETEARERAQLQLRRADRLAAVGKTTAVFAHELGTPLAVVVGRADRLIRHAPDEAVRANAEAIHAQAERMTGAIRRLLDYARHDDHLELRPTSIGPVLDASLALVEERGRRAGVQLTVDRPWPDLPVDGDPQALQQVFTNLLHNAFDASPPGGEVHLGAEAHAGSAIVRLEDRGPGIPDDLRERVFDPFFTTKSAVEGTGLGLSVVQEIVHDHGGVVALEAREGGGLRVVVRLPLREVARG